MRVIVCGSRTFTDYKTVEKTLNGFFTHILFDELITEDDLIIISGGARGADGLATHWAERMHTPFRVFDADWARYPGAAGPIRNKQMLDAGADLVIAFIDKPLHESKGTRNMVAIARNAGVRTIVVEVTPARVQVPDPALF